MQVVRLAPTERCITTSSRRGSAIFKARVRGWHPYAADRKSAKLTPIFWALCNAGRKELRDAQYVAERDGLVTATAEGLKAAGEVPPAPSTPAERLAMWCDHLPSPAPEMLVSSVSAAVRNSRS